MGPAEDSAVLQRSSLFSQPTSGSIGDPMLSENSFLLLKYDYLLWNNKTKTVHWWSAGQGVRKCPKKTFLNVKQEDHLEERVCSLLAGVCEPRWGPEWAIVKDSSWDILTSFFYNVGKKTCPIHIHGFTFEIHTYSIFFFSWFLSFLEDLKSISWCLGEWLLGGAIDYITITQLDEQRPSATYHLI